MDKLSLASLRTAGSSWRCDRGSDHGNWNSDGSSSLKSSKGLGLVSSDRGDDGDKGNKEERKLEHVDVLFLCVFVSWSLL